MGWCGSLARPSAPHGSRFVNSQPRAAHRLQTLQALIPPSDLVLLTGDLADIGRPEKYAHLAAILALLHTRVLAVAGNHDDRTALRGAFAEEGYLPAPGYLQCVIDDEYPLRLVGLDTMTPGETGGALCADRFAEIMARHTKWRSTSGPKAPAPFAWSRLASCCTGGRSRTSSPTSR